jgi:hypothetical protein
MHWVTGGLWQAIPSAYRQGHCFTDFWAAYSAVIPDEQHTAVGKEMGETAHVERWNNTLRQRLARFVRMTLSFSKSAVMLEAYLLLFAPLSSSLQSRAGHPAQMSHYHISQSKKSGAKWFRWLTWTKKIAK